MSDHPERITDAIEAIVDALDAIGIEADVSATGNTIRVLVLPDSRG